jgi:hypothetical protein
VVIQRRWRKKLAAKKKLAVKEDSDEDSDEDSGNAGCQIIMKVVDGKTIWQMQGSTRETA